MSGEVVFSFFLSCGGGGGVSVLRGQTSWAADEYSKVLGFTLDGRIQRCSLAFLLGTENQHLVQDEKV